MTVEQLSVEAKSPVSVCARAKPATIKRLSIMLTEICNLDCWMCDFAKSKKLTKVLPYTPEEVVRMLAHPVFRNSLRTLTFTGGEPFAYPKITQLYQAVRDAYPDLRCNFSSNCTLISKMVPVFDSVKNWKKVGLLVSIDGIARHDQQRGKEGAFDKTFDNLEFIRKSYPELSITLKFTITPLNFDELEKTFEFFNSRGYRFTAKMLEHNPYYTNKLTTEVSDEGGEFTLEQFQSIERQIKGILSNAPRAGNKYRIRELEELLESLNENWKRTSRCSAPTDVAFLDANLDFFTCKEYPAVLNLGSESLDQLCVKPQYSEIRKHEHGNTGKCTRCTSQMKRTSEVGRWVSYLASFLR